MAIRYADAWKNMMPSVELLPNPHKGFTTFQRFKGDALNENWSVKTGWKMEHIPSDLQDLYRGEITGYPDCSIAYFRIPWRKLEPEEGVYDFSFLDYVLEEATRRGQHVMLRFPPHAARPGELDLPEWFINKLHLPEREIGNKMSPDHPAFFEQYSALIKAVGNHIDGDKRVTAVDMALISAWGEGAQIDMVPEEKWKILVDAYMEAFPNTPLSGLFNHPGVIRYANTFRPVGFRADCLGDMNSHMFNHYPLKFPLIGQVWTKAPVSFESCWVLKHWYDMGWDLDYIIEQSLKWHITSLNAKSVAIPEAWKEQVEDWIKKMGYRFAVRRCAYPSEAEAGDTLKVHFWIENRGVAPIYHKYPFVLRLRNEWHTYTFETTADISTWLPGDNLLDDVIVLPEDMAPGEYILEAGITDGSTKVLFANDTPRFEAFSMVSDIIRVR